MGSSVGEKSLVGWKRRPASAGGGRFRPVLVLVVLAPVISELLGGSVPISFAWTLLFFGPMYGAGALLVRELVRRRRRGWASVLLLGVAYALVEEGVALQSLFSPTLYGAAGWAPRIFGINSAYTEIQLVYHALFSVAIPILLTDLVFPARRAAPYLGRVGLAVTGAVYVFGVALVGLTARVTLTPGYLAPPALIGLAALGALVLGAASLFVLPEETPGKATARPPGGTAPAPRTALLAGGLGTFAYLALLFPFGGAEHPAFTRGDLVPVPMLAALALAAAMALLVRRWSRAGGWGDLHLLALAGGALVAHTAFGMLVFHETTADRLGLAALGAVMVVLLALLATRVRAGVRRDAAEA